LSLSEKDDPGKFADPDLPNGRESVCPTGKPTERRFDTIPTALLE